MWVWYTPWLLCDVITILSQIFTVHPNQEKSHPVYVEYAPSRNFWLSRMCIPGCLQF